MSGTVAFIGLGAMGGPMAGTLAKAGYHMAVFDRVLAKAEAVAAESGGRVAASAAAAADGAKFVFTSVVDDVDLRSVTSGPGGTFDAMAAGKARGKDVVIVDTAGRMHTKRNLMEELKKMVRIAERELPGAPHDIYLVLDATTGQNALSQARQFVEAVGVTGIIITKLDGTAKGGIVAGVVKQLKVPICYIGTGEQLEDLIPFEAETFVEPLFGD